MRIFGKKKSEEPMDDRTKIEKSFEEKGQEIGKLAGELTQKGLDRFTDIKVKLEEEGKLDKLYEVSDKVSSKTKEVVNKVTDKTKTVMDKTRKNKDE